MRSCRDRAAFLSTVTEVELKVVSFAFERAEAYSEGNARQLRITACCAQFIFLYIQLVLSLRIHKSFWKVETLRFYESHQLFVLTYQVEFYHFC